MKKNFFGGLFIVALVAIAAFNINMNVNNNEMSTLSLANVEALAQNEDGNSLWFSNLRWVECEIGKINGGGGFYYRGVFIAAGAAYTFYGNKQRCNREVTTNTCNLSSETPCA